LLSFILLSVFYPRSIQAQDPRSLSEDEIIASYVYNFIKNVQWPEQNDLQHISLGIYPSVDPSFSSQLIKHLDGVKIGSAALNTSIAALGNLTDFQALYLGEINQEEMESIYTSIGPQPVLLISSEVPDKQLVMINLYSTRQNFIRFEVNKANMVAQGLRVNPDIILNGGSEIDVAQLFKEGQASLIKMQQRMRQNEATFSQLESGIKTLQHENQTLNQSLKNLKQTISQNQQQLSLQKAELAMQEQKLQSVEAERRNLELALAQKNQQLSDRQLLLESIGQKISNREAQLKTLNDTLLRQKSRIIELDNTIATQDLMVNNLLALVALGVILVALAVWAYISKRRDAERLEAQGRDLKIARDKLNIAKVKAEEANQAKSEFLSLMSHELRTPLQAIIGYTEVVIEDLKLEGLESYTNDLNRVVNNSERLLRLINGVLDLAKIESGNMKLFLAPVDLEATVADAAANVLPQFDEKGLALNINANNGPDLPIIDGEKLLHIVLNLLSNACKFTEIGSVTLVAEHRVRELFLSVQDTGVGIRPKQLAHVFERFRQADSSTTRRHQGSGLGLAITKQFCEIMGGSISVNSEMNVGTRFTVRIPLPIDQKAMEQRNRLEQEQARFLHDEDHLGLNSPAMGKQFRVLMIDDDREFLTIMSRSLRKAGYFVFTAINAEEGLRLANDLNPDLIVMDLLLPDMHGWKLLEAIKANQALENIPVIVASVSDDKTRGETLGISNYLTKPIAHEALHQAVKKLTEKSLA